MNGVFKLACQNTIASNHGQKNLSYMVPLIWNKLPDSSKTTENVNTFKHRVKKHFFCRKNNEENNIYSYI